MIETLEARRLLSATPSSVLTAANRQTLLSGMTLPTNTRTALQGRLNAHDTAGFDAQLLSYMQNRTNAHFFFDPGDAATIGAYISNNVGDGNSTARADNVVAHILPADGNQTSYTYHAGTDIDWKTAGGNSDTLHAINRMAFWDDLSEAYRFTGDSKYVNELISELASWSAAFPTVSIPTTWSKDDQRDWTLDMAVRGDQWNWSYFQILSSSAWTKEANSLFLFKQQQQNAFLAANPNTYPLTDNRSLFLSSTWLETTEAFPEFNATNATAARTQMYAAFDGQYYPDGSYREQAPGYQDNGIENMLELKLLDSDNNVSWTTARNNQLIGAVDAYYQLLSPDGARPALGDTYRDTSATTFLKADYILGVGDRWAPAKPRGRDVWLLGTDVASDNEGNPNYPDLSDRGTTYSSTYSGDYIMRSDGSDPNARQITFQAGPKGGAHGHAAPLNFELFGYGKPLISDPGLVSYDTSADRTWAVSTPAHNTISADGLNAGDMDDIGTGAPGMVVDEWTTEPDYTMVTAHSEGYDGLAGKPVVSRSIWYDNDGTMLILDYAEGQIAHDYTTSFLVPGTSYTADLTHGKFQSTGSGGNVTIQSLLTSGQTAKRETRFVSNTPPPYDEDPAQRYFVTQNGKYVVFATLITAYNGTNAPNTTASFVTSNPQPGQAIQMSLTQNGFSQTINFAPPDITRLNSAAHSNGSYSDIAYDANGNLHMVYYDRDRKQLKYAEKLKATGTWTTVETIDNGYLCGSNPSIAIDTSGNVGVAYTDGNAGDLKYAHFNGTNWDVESVDTKGSTGHYPSLAFSRTGGPVIAYYNKTNGDLRMASSSGAGGWTITTIDSGTVGNKDVGRFASLVLDPSRPDASKWAIAYDDGSSGYTLYAIQGKISGGTYNASNGYTIFRADHSFGGYISLAFDSSNRPTLSHYDVNTGDLRFAKSSGSTLSGGINFSASTVASYGTVGTYTALYYDTTGKAVILYWDKSHNKLAKARFTTAWTITNLVTGGHEIHVAKYKDTVAYTNVDDTSLSVLYM